MKREGRQHGMVRTYRVTPDPLNPRPNSRLVNKLDSPPTAGVFTVVRSKPTNHSKFTGKCGQSKCGECHMHPVSKSKDKTKGTQKIKSCDMSSNYNLLSFRVVDGRPEKSFSGASATGVLHQLDSGVLMDDYNYDDDDDYEVEVGSYDGSISLGYVVDDDDDMSYCDVGFVMEQVEGDGDWCIVEEM